MKRDFKEVREEFGSRLLPFADKYFERLVALDQLGWKASLIEYKFFLSNFEKGEREVYFSHELEGIREKVGLGCYRSTALAEHREQSLAKYRKSFDEADVYVEPIGKILKRAKADQDFNKELKLALEANKEIFAGEAKLFKDSVDKQLWVKRVDFARKYASDYIRNIGLELDLLRSTKNTLIYCEPDDKPWSFSVIIDVTNLRKNIIPYDVECHSAWIKKEFRPNSKDSQNCLSLSNYWFFPISAPLTRNLYKRFSEPHELLAILKCHVDLIGALIKELDGLAPDFS